MTDPEAITLEIQDISIGVSDEGPEEESTRSEE